MADSSTHLKTFKYRLYPTDAQEKNLFRVLNAARGLYNMALAERKLAWQIEKRSVSLAEIEQLAKHYRATFPYAGQMFSQTAQSVVKQVEAACQAFFRHLKAGEKSGYPRFKGRQHFHSFEFKQFGMGARLGGRRLKLYGIGRVAVRWHCPIEGDIKTVRIVHKAGHLLAMQFVLPRPDAFRSLGGMRLWPLPRQRPQCRDQYLKASARPMGRIGER